MKEQAEKLKDVEKNLSESQGQFELFALFLREDSPGKWDLLISAEWARADKKAAINLVIDEIRKVLTDQEIMMLSRIIVLDKDDNALETIRKMMKVEHGLAEIRDFNFLGLDIKHAYLITSQKNACRSENSPHSNRRTARQ